MKNASLLFLFLSSFAIDANCQKYLIIEKAGSPRTQRISIFDEITFQLKDDDKGWYKRQIFDLNADAQLILLGDTWVPLNDITRIRLKRQRVWASIVGGALQGGGASMFLGDLYYTVIKDEPKYTQGGMEIGVINMVVGAAIRAIFGPIKYKLGDRRRLRVIDITFRSNDKT
ncbi:MAG TPA: hypothetical protein VMZ69_10610 [Saprospiraceae bacterium]|nr:hypothetical protein [Saprospiraceae bacterium]